MSYIKQNFVNGDVLTAEELNAMDNQIARNEENIASVSDPTVAFTDASDRTALTTGTKLSVLMGRISKWLKDLKNAAFCDVANNDTTTDAGYVADARIVKTHGDEIDTLLDKLTWKELTIPNPTVSSDGKTRTYSVNLRDYSEICIHIFMNEWGRSDCRSFRRLDEQEYFYIMDTTHGYKCTVNVKVTNDTIKILQYNSNFASSNYVFISRLSVR